MNSKLAIIILFLLPVFVIAQPADSIHLTLKTSIARALNRNPQLLSSRFSLKKAQWDKRRAWTQLFPKISFNTRFMRIDDQSFAERDFRRYLPPELAGQMPQTVFQKSWSSSFDLSLTLFNTGVWNGLMISRANLTMADDQNESVHNLIIFQVISSYLNLLKAQKTAQLQSQFLDLSERNYQKAERIYQADIYAKSDILRWKLEAQQQKSAVETSRAALRSAETMIRRLLNLNEEITINIDEALPQWLEQETHRVCVQTESDILAMIQLNDEELIKHNAALRAAHAGTDIYKWLYRNGYSSFFPEINLSYSHGWRENNTIALDDYSPKTLMLNLTFPIFNSFQDYAALKSSYYEYKISEADFLDQIKQTRYLLTETVNRILTLRYRNELALTNRELSDQNYRIVEHQWEQNLLSNIELIDAKLNCQNNALEEIYTHYDLIAAVVELHYLLGRLTIIID